MLPRRLSTTLLLSMTLLASLGAAETPLVSGVAIFQNEWIENASKEIVPGPGSEAKALRTEVAAKPQEDWQAQTWTRALSGTSSLVIR